MIEEQPEALPARLAKRLCDGISTGHDWPNTDDELLRMQSAAELRRLHAENEALRAQIGHGVPDEMPTSAAERHLRLLLAVRVGMQNTYFEEGEAYGAEHGISIDFMREPVAHIDAKLRALNVARAECAPQQKPLTVTEDQAWNLARYVYAHSNPHESPQILLSAQEIKQIIEAAHNIGEKK